MHGIGQTGDAFRRLVTALDGLGRRRQHMMGGVGLGFDFGIREEQGGIVGAMSLVTHDLAAVQFDHALAHRVDDLFVMRGHDDGGAGAVDGVQHFHDAQRSGRVEVAGGLVGQQNLRVIHVGAGDGHTLLLATGELMRIVLFLAGESHGIQHLGHQRFDGGPPRADHLKGERHVLPYGFVIEQLVILEHEAQRTAVLRHLTVGDAPQIVAGHANLAAGGLLLAQQQAQERGLAGAGRTHKEHEITAFDIEVDAVKRRSGAFGIDLGHIVQ